MTETFLDWFIAQQRKVRIVATVWSVAWVTWAAYQIWVLPWWVKPVYALIGVGHVVALWLWWSWIPRRWPQYWRKDA